MQPLVSLFLLLCALVVILFFWFIMYWATEGYRLWHKWDYDFVGKFTSHKARTCKRHHLHQVYIQCERCSYEGVDLLWDWVDVGCEEYRDLIKNMVKEEKETEKTVIEKTKESIYKKVECKYK